jgi:hypothetical protein
MVSAQEGRYLQLENLSANLKLVIFILSQFKTIRTLYQNQSLCVLYV